MRGPTTDRNLAMAALVEAAPVGSPVRFVVAGDSGAWPDPTAEAIFAAVVAGVAALESPPLFFANLGDFAGPGTAERHARYLDLVAPLPCPDLCVLGNHDVDDARGEETFARVHGPATFDFAHADIRFVVLRAAPGVPGIVEVPGQGTPAGVEGPRAEDLAALDERLRAAREPHRVVLMHMPPFSGGRFAPHPDWGFRVREAEFLALLREHRVSLVCCAHGLAFDTWLHDGIRFVLSGGGGTGLCSHYRGVCTEGDATPERRGSLFHAVELTIAPDGAVSGRVLQAFAPPGATAIRF